MSIKKYRKFLTDKIFHRILFLIIFITISVTGYFYLNLDKTQDRLSSLQVLQMNLGEENEELKRQIANNFAELEELKRRDEYNINIDLEENIENIETTYRKSVSVYEELLELKDIDDDTSDLDEKYTASLVLLSQQKYEEATEALDDLSKKIASERQEIVASFTIPVSVPTSNDAPSSGYSRQQVSTDVGNFLVSIIAGDLSSTRIIVDTASASDCANECPVLPLSEYVSRNNAYAGVNGTYFCPASYPSCAGKTNTFDLLVMNKDKTYFNSNNNVYSTNPAVIFGGSYIRFVGQVQEWGRDTGIDSMLSNFPMLVQGGNLAFAGDSDPKKGSKANRPFIANKGSSVYIGVVQNATVVEAGHTLKALGMENALNLDSGGSTALWSGGYKFGPGRNIPNAILFVRK